MNDKVKDLSNQKIRQVYLNHEGHSLSPFNETLITNDEYLIMTCRDIQLINKYFVTDKRVYILLDKNVSSRDYTSISAENIWFIPTDLVLPTLILTDKYIYHVPFGLKQNNNHTYVEVKNYLMYLIKKYAQKQFEIDDDFFEPELSSVIKHSGLNDLIESTSSVISNSIDSKSLIGSIIRSNSQYSYKLIDNQFINYIDVIRLNKLNPVIQDNNSFIELKIEFDFDIKKLKHKEIFPEITYLEATKQKYFDLNNVEVIVKDQEIIESTIKVDLLRQNDEEHLKKEENKVYNQYPTSARVLKQIFKFDLEQMTMNDFKNVKLLNDKEKKEQYENIDLTDLTLYQNNEGVIAVSKTITVEMKKIKNLKYVVIR